MANPVSPFSQLGPPQNLEAERACLGACLTNIFALWECTQLLTPVDFCKQEYGQVFAAMVALSEHEDPRVDVVTVGEELQRHKVLESCGGYDFLRELEAKYGDSPEGIETYARVVRDKARLRRLHEAGQQIAQLGWNAELEAETAEAQASDLLTALVERDAGATQLSAVEWVQQEEEAAKSKRPVTLVDTPWDYVNKAALLMAGDVTVLGGLTSHGKTAISLNLAWHNVQRGRRTYLWVGEMSRKQIYARLVALHTGYPLQNIVNRNLNVVEWQGAMDTAKLIDSLPLVIQDRRGMYLREIEADMRLVARRQGKIELGLIDYLQILGDLNSEIEDDSRRDVRVGKCVWRAGIMAERLGCHIIMGSQFNGQPNARYTSRPRISDMRDSRQIEQHAGNVWMIYRPERDENLPTEEQERQKGTAELIIGKQRQGNVGSIWLKFSGAEQRFDNLQLDRWPKPAEGKRKRH